MVMVGGNSRNSGKTTVACSIINKLSATQKVIGLKVTSIRHGEGDMHGNHHEEFASGFSVFEEHNSESLKDTSKMLRAGALHVYFIRAEDTFAEQAILQFFSSYINNELIVCESRSLRNIIIPGLFVMMIREPAISKPKEVTGFLEKADCIFDYSSQQSEIQYFNDNLQFIENQFQFQKSRSTNETR